LCGCAERSHVAIEESSSTTLDGSRARSEVRVDSSGEGRILHEIIYLSFAYAAIEPYARRGAVTL
jgi:hypothetical protein